MISGGIVWVSTVLSVVVTHAVAGKLAS
uniref:Uncharacterized protein n=1 Tax=Anguilla anguilla TaxID=7936 RepID=A0A0E9VI24_ANGAN